MKLSQIACYFIVTVVLLILAGCGSGGGSGANGANQAVYSFRLPPVGTTLTYASHYVQDNYSTNYTYTRSISKINTDGSYTSILTNNQGGPSTSVAELHDAAGNLLSETTTSSPPITILTFDPKAVTTPYPLYVGKTWSSNCIESTSIGPSSNWQLTDGVAVGTEYVTVPAGTFNAIKVEYNILGTPISTTSYGTIISETTTCWLAIDTSIPVKCQHKFSYGNIQIPVIVPANSVIDQLQSIQ